MKYPTFYLILLLLGLSQLVSGDNGETDDMKYFLYEDENGNVQVEDLVNAPLNLTASESDVKYHFFSKSNPTQSVEIHSNNIAALKKTSFTANKETLFIIHGWKNSHASDVNSHIREYVLRHHDINVFVVDWSPMAGKNYVSAQGSVKLVGEYVAKFAKALNTNFHLNLSKLKFVGHSLGAHVCGNAGAALHGQVDRIVGLDPAGPLFVVRNKDNRIDASDAKHVQIIHTNGGTLGYSSACGDSDYYPNGGSSQPGCGLDITGSCSHSRAYELYAESLTSNKFVSQRCSSYSEYGNGKCHGSKTSMGMFNIDTKASGAYYLKTNSKSPYALG